MSLPACMKFARGDRVRLTRRGRRAFLFCCLGKPPRDRGTVVGFHRSTSIVKVLRDGTKTPTEFFVGFWEKEPPNAKG